MTAAATPPFRLRAYGLCVDATWPIPGSHPTAALPTDGSRNVYVSHAGHERLSEIWQRSGERVFEPEFTDGTSHFTVDRTTEEYRLWFDDFGRYAVACDGSRAECDASVARERCERFLFAQILPLAAVLHGFDLLHAGAVAGRSGVAAFVGRSGTGKTMMITKLVSRGATLVTDDVLALELIAGRAVAHPGPPLVAVAPGDATPQSDWRVAGDRPVGETDKVLHLVTVCERPLPLKVLYHLEPHPCFELTEVPASRVDRVLANAFAPYVTTPARLLQRLEMSEVVSRSVPQFVLRVPRTGDAPDIVGVLEDHLREAGV